MTNLVDEKRLEELMRHQMLGEIKGLRTPEENAVPDYSKLLRTLSLALKVIRAVKKFKDVPFKDVRQEMFDSIAPFSQGEKEPKE